MSSSLLRKSTAGRLASLRLTTATAAPRAAAFSVSSNRPKTATESVKDGLKTVDRKVSDKIVGGIDMGANVAHKVKEVGQNVSDGKATDKAQEIGEDMRAEGKEKAGELKGKAHEAAGKAKNAAEDVKRKL